MIGIIEEVGPGKVFGVVTDNAANMKRAWREINNKYEHITTYGCVAHALSLLINDIISLKSFQIVIKGGVTVVNNIRRRHVLHAVFNEKQKESDINKKKSLMLSVRTRWGSVVVFLNSLLANKQIIRLLNIDERCENDIEPRVKQFINNDIFWDRINNLHNFLKPIAYWITRIESDLPQLNIVPEIFVEIKKQYDTCIKNVSCFESEKNLIQDKIQSRKEFSVQKIHLAANVLHPKYRGNNLTANENVDAATFIHRLSKTCLDIDEQKVMHDFAHYKVKEGIFSNTYIWEMCSDSLEPAVWWNAYCLSTELFKLASKILSLPATSAACERTFSTYKDVHSFKRNRLTNSRAGKLVYIKHNLKLQEETSKQLNPPHVAVHQCWAKFYLDNYSNKYLFE